MRPRSASKPSRGGAEMIGTVATLAAHVGAIPGVLSGPAPAQLPAGRREGPPAKISERGAAS